MDCLAEEPNLTTEEISLRREIATQLEGHFPRHASEYVKVTVLLLLWEQDDLGCGREVTELANLFEQQFRFDTQQFLIPSERSQNSLLRTVMDFVETCGNQSNLLIIYYAGHGDPDEGLGRTKRAVWAAKRDGGPTLDWFAIQPTLETCGSNVLMILDCCFAAQAARGRELRKVELLAAAAMGSFTPGPGKSSFTRALIREMTWFLETHQSFSVTQLHRQLVKAEANLMRTPVYVDLSENVSGSIVLRPMPEKAAIPPVTENLVSMTFTLSLSDRPDKLQMEQLVQWLRKDSPTIISAVTIERVFLKVQETKNLRELVKTHLSDDAEKWNRNWISDEARQSILDRCEEVEALLSAPNLLGGDSRHPGNPDHIDGLLRKADTLSNDAHETARSCLMNLEPDGLKNLESSETAKAVGLSHSALTRLILLDLVQLPASFRLSSGAIKFSAAARAGERFRYGRLQQNQAKVIVEYFNYQPEKNTAEAPAGVAQQVRKMAVLLSTHKIDTFRTLPCLGTVYEPIYTRFGLVFQLPSLSSECTNNSLLINQFKACRYVSLASRFQMAHRLALSILQFHAIGWLHKNISSENIGFFSFDGSIETLPNFSEPFLFGFEYSRTKAEESNRQRDFNTERNLYRHPCRWGDPSEDFNQEHDVYSLGVVLLEIGFWTKAATITGKLLQKFKAPDELRDNFIELAGVHLSHYMGDSYSKATEMCLSGRFQIGFEKEGWKNLKVFREGVVDKLAKAAVSV